MAAWDNARICVDCAIWQANGDASGMDEATESRVRAVQGNWVVGDDWGFSWSRCDACGDSRGGDRFSAMVEVG
jgi:hypothetical protein